MRLFVSYRRSDSPHVAGRLRDHLAATFGDENVFYDVDSIEAGVDFRAVIRETLEKVDAVVAVIGPHFELDRLSQPDDFVRKELVEALTQGKFVLPVLVEDARMPTVDELPAELEEFSYINAAPLRRDPDFRRDADRLVESLRRAVVRRESTLTHAEPTAMGLPTAPAMTTRPGRGTRWAIVAAAAVLGVSLVIGAVLLATNGKGGPDARSETTTTPAATAAPPTQPTLTSTSPAPPTLPSVPPTTPVPTLPPVVVPNLVHSYHREQYAIGEVRDLVINDDASYYFTVRSPTVSYLEQGVVNANDAQITFSATLASESNPALALARGSAAKWWIVPDAVGSLEFHLLFPQHDGYGGTQGDDVYYVQ